MSRRRKATFRPEMNCSQKRADLVVEIESFLFVLEDIGGFVRQAMTRVARKGDTCPTPILPRLNV